MRKLTAIILTLLCIFILVFGFSILKKKISKDFSQPVSIASPTKLPSPTNVPIDKNAERNALFVPYWGLAKDIPTTYDTVIYFGITPTRNGINKEELGYKGIGAFLKNVPRTSEKLLTLRMLENKENFAIIESPQNRKAVIQEAIATARDNGFSGIVLDLEISAIPFESVVKNINTFVSEFSDEAKKQNLLFSIAIYGDTFYRARPFDLKRIGQKADKVMIMAYDLHKARGNPGPNFPLSGNENYGYDIEQMVRDFSEKVPSKKLAIVFGMFGYDWEVNSKDKAVGVGKSLAYVDIKKSFIDSCEYLQCEWHRDDQSGEIVVNYLDDASKKHIVWFEDPTSVARKEEFLKTRGISSFAFWAHSYF